MRRTLFVAGLLWLGLAGLAAASFVEVSQLCGTQFQHLIAPICMPPLTVGSAWADYDNDGDPDLFLTNHGGPNRLFRNEGDTNGDNLPDFVEVAAALGVAQPGEVGLGTVFVDYDNDGDQDLLVLNWGGNALFKNRLIEDGQVSFEDVTDVADLRDGGRAITAAWGDYDDDGYLDVYLAKHGECDTFSNNVDGFYHNNGNGTFTLVNNLLCSGPCDALDHGLGFAPGWFDYDLDGDLDLYVVNDNIQETHSKNVLWRNDGPDGQGGWIFTDVSVQSGTDISLNGMGLAIGDVDNDGWLDMAFSNIGKNKLLRNRGDGTFADVSALAGIEREFVPGGESITWGTELFDYDNDRDLDLMFVAGYIDVAPFSQPNALFRNNLDSTFTDVSASQGIDDTGRGRNASVVDFDRDGAVDLLVANFGGNTLLYRNQVGNSNGWLSASLEGRVSNRDAIGSMLWLTTSTDTQVRLISSGPTHGGGDYREAYFGMGGRRTGDLVVRWPNLAVQRFRSVDRRQHLHLVEPLFLVDAPANPVAGQPLSFHVTGATPGATVELFAGTGPGRTELPGCPQVWASVEGGLARKSAVANGNGEATITITPGLAASGKWIYAHISQPSSCALSNRVEIKFQ